MELGCDFNAMIDGLLANLGSRGFAIGDFCSPCCQLYGRVLGEEGDSVFQCKRDTQIALKSCTTNVRFKAVHTACHYLRSLLPSSSNETTMSFPTPSQATSINRADCCDSIVAHKCQSQPLELITNQARKIRLPKRSADHLTVTL